MSLIFIDGFELNDYNLGKYDVGTPESITTGRFGGQCARFTGSGSMLKLFVPQEDDEIILGFGAYFENLTNDNSTNAQMVRFLSDAGVTVHLSFTVDATGVVRIRRGGGNGTELGASVAGVITLNTWHYVEIRAILSDTVGEVEVYVDGVQRINQTGLDTKNAGTKVVFDGVSFGRVVSTAWRVDDIYILNTQGAVNNDFLGECKVVASLPIADATVQWDSEPSLVNTFQAIDEPTPSGVDYIYSPTAAEKAMYDMTALADLDHAVYGVQASGYVAKDTAGTRSVKFRAESVAANALSSAITLPSSLTTKTAIFETDPNGSIAWTPASVNAAYFGVEVA